MPHLICKGHTINEFGLLIAFLGVLSIGSLALFGHSIHDLIGMSAGKPASGNMPSDLLTPLSGSTVAVTGIPATGKNVSLPMTSPVGNSGSLNGNLNALSPISVNVSSVDGNSENTLGSYRLAAYLDQLAAQQSDPNNQAYLSQMAKLAYYMGANESELDDYSVFAASGTPRLSNAEALNDMISKQTQLEALINNPPASVRPQDLQVATPLANQVNAIAQSYHDSLSGALTSNGKATTDFMLTAKNTPGVLTGLGVASQPGAQIALMNNSQAQPGKTYESIMPYDQLKEDVAGLLKSNPVVTDVPVITTYNNAQTVDNIPKSN